MASLALLRQQLGEGRTKTSAEIRNMYNCLLKDLNAQHVLQHYQEKHGDDACAVAEVMHGYRQIVKQYARERGSWWHEQFLNLRDLIKYGRFSGPSFQDLIGRGFKKAQDKGEAVDQQAVCQRILESATRTNNAINQAYGEGDETCLLPRQLKIKQAAQQQAVPVVQLETDGVRHAIASETELHAGAELEATAAASNAASTHAPAMENDQVLL